MKKLLGGAAALAAGVALVAPALPASAIVGGAPDAGEHPYVGQLLFYVPNAIDSRFDDPGGWFNCTGTLIDADTVVTAGHCTYDVGLEGVAPEDPLFGGTDVWFTRLRGARLLDPAAQLDVRARPQRGALRRRGRRRSTPATTGPRPSRRSPIPSTSTPRSCSTTSASSS